MKSVGGTRWRRFLLVGVGVVALAAYLGTLLVFQTSKRARLRDLRANSSVVDTSRGPVEYRFVGEGPVVLFLHGTPGGYDQSRLFEEPFVRAGFGFLAMSRPGYLRTPLSVGGTPEEQADAAVALLDALGHDTVAVIGGSGGGPYALALALRHPTRVSALVLAVAATRRFGEPIEPQPLLNRMSDRLLGDSFLQWQLFARAERSPRARILDGPFADAFSDDTKRRFAQDDAKLEAFVQLLWSTFPDGIRRDGYLADRRNFLQLDLGDLGTIRTPTFVVHGDADANAPFQHAEYATGTIPDAELLRFEGGDHYIMISRPEAFWPPIIEFLRAQQSG